MVSGGFYQPYIPDVEHGRLDCSMKEGMHSGVAA